VVCGMGGGRGVAFGVACPACIAVSVA